MKLPHIQFYPGDWRKDVAVQSLSYHHRGVWFELLTLMHCSEDRGRLVSNGVPIANAGVARLLGLSERESADAISVLLDAGVASRDESGALYSRRMVRENEIAAVRKQNGSKGGSKTQAKRQANLNQNPDIDIGNGNGSEKQKKTEWVNRFAAVFHRRPGTPWSEKEVSAFKLLLPIDEEDFSMIERYYKAERHRENNICRRDLQTFLNNYRGEVDRARAWCRRHSRVESQSRYLPPPREPSEEEFQRMRNGAREASAKLREELCA